MRKFLMLILALAIVFPTGVDAGKNKKNNHHRRENRDIMLVQDYTSPEWGGVIQETVGDFNAVMPKSGPRLVYQRMSYVSCSSTTITTVCSGLTDLLYLGLAYSYPNGGGRIELREVFGVDGLLLPSESLACHELMHIVAKVGDNYGAFPNTSCVWGYLSNPGSKDVELLRDAYGKDKKDKKDKKNKKKNR